jgi:hypothetical protein
MALFKVVLCTWGKIVGDAVWVAIPRATSGCKERPFIGRRPCHLSHLSFRLWTVRASYLEDRVE